MNICRIAQRGGDRRIRNADAVTRDVEAKRNWEKSSGNWKVSIPAPGRSSECRPRVTYPVHLRNQSVHVVHVVYVVHVVHVVHVVRVYLTYNPPTGCICAN